MTSLTVKAVDLFITIILSIYYQLVLVFEIFTDGKEKNAPRKFVAVDILSLCQQVIMQMISLFLH